jgi:hypothetical protein
VQHRALSTAALALLPRPTADAAGWRWLDRDGIINADRGIWILHAELLVVLQSCCRAPGAHRMPLLNSA